MEDGSMKIREALMALVKTALKVKEMSDAMESLGYPDNPYWDIYSEICDSIYNLICEDTDTFTDSLTYKALNNPKLTNEERVDILLGK